MIILKFANHSEKVSFVSASRLLLSQIAVALLLLNATYSLQRISMKHPLSTFNGEYNSNGDEVSIRSVAREMKSQFFSFDVKNASYEESMKLDDILSFFFLSLCIKPRIRQQDRRRSGATHINATAA